MAMITGTSGNVLITPGEITGGVGGFPINFGDTISSLDGDDTGGGGHDVINGGNCDDSFRGGAGNEIVNGDAGNDFGYDDAGPDTLGGSVGNDML